MKLNTLQELYIEELRDLYSAETQLTKALPKMAKAAQSSELKSAFQKHHTETEGQVDRLEQVFDEIGVKPTGKTCDAIMGILEEGKSIIEDYKGAPALDAGLIAAAQAVEHYEIARYGTLRTWAEELGYSGSVKLLQETLDQEEATDEALTELATNSVNAHAEAAE